jgi:diguanylate cyclase (GGDEF)-like protein
MRLKELVLKAGSLLLLAVPVPTPTVTVPALPATVPNTPIVVPSLPPDPIAVPPVVLPTAVPTAVPIPVPIVPPLTVPNLPVLSSPGQPADPPRVGQPPVQEPAAGVGGDLSDTGFSGVGAEAAPEVGSISQPPSRPVGAGSGAPRRSLQPFIQLPPGRTGQVLALALMFLPLLVGLWLLAMGRTLRAAGLARSTSLRLNVAADLGIRPRELTAMSAETLAKVRDEIAVDELTGVVRRASGVAALERELARSRRHRRPLVVAFVDVDGLKSLNDTKGHVAGDALLKGVAQVLQKRLRAEDVVFRYGGDEFVCLLPDTELHGAQQAFEEMAGKAKHSGRSFSFGLAEHRTGDDAVSLLGRADQALYEGREQRTAAGERFGWREGSRRPVTF